MSSVGCSTDEHQIDALITQRRITAIAHDRRAFYLDIEREIIAIISIDKTMIQSPIRFTHNVAAKLRAPPTTCASRFDPRTCDRKNSQNRVAGLWYAYPSGVSGDGAFVVGSISVLNGNGPDDALRWTSSGQVLNLGDLPGFCCSEASAASLTGSAIAPTCVKVAQKCTPLEYEQVHEFRCRHGASTNTICPKQIRRIRLRQ